MADHIVSVNGKTRTVVVLYDLINAVSYTVEHCVSPKTDAILEATHMGLEFIFTKKSWMGKLGAARAMGLELQKKHVGAITL